MMFHVPQPEVHANCPGALPETATELPDPENKVTHSDTLFCHPTLANLRGPGIILYRSL